MNSSHNNATISDIKRIIDNNKKDIAFVIGNGINRYPNNPPDISWENLLIELWEKASIKPLKSIPSGTSLTEFYDLLELENIREINLQKSVANKLVEWEPQKHHKTIIERIRAINAPVLTTNFDETLGRSFDFDLFKTENLGFTDFYPWTTYHGESQIELPTDGFGVWYINGMIKYQRSIRLGLSHYMGSVEKARNLLHKGNEERLFSGKNINNWKGSKTWLHIVFNKSLFIFGLELEENETFLRWLLIQRIKYFNRFQGKMHQGWYICKRDKNESKLGKKFFLERVGFKIIEVDDYKDIYENLWN